LDQSPQSALSVSFRHADVCKSTKKRKEKTYKLLPNQFIFVGANLTYFGFCRTEKQTRESISTFDPNPLDVMPSQKFIVKIFLFGSFPTFFGSKDDSRKEIWLLLNKDQLSVGVLGRNVQFDVSFFSATLASESVERKQWNKNL